MMMEEISAHSFNRISVVLRILHLEAVSIFAIKATGLQDLPSILLLITVMRSLTYTAPFLMATNNVPVINSVAIDWDQQWTYMYMQRRPYTRQRATIGIGVKLYHIH